MTNENAIRAWKGQPNYVAALWSHFFKVWGKFIWLQMSTLVVAEHEGGSIKQSSLSAVAAAGAISEGNSISVLLAGSGSSLQEAASHAATSHPSVSQVVTLSLYAIGLSLHTYFSFKVLLWLSLCAWLECSDDHNICSWPYQDQQERTCLCSHSIDPKWWK